jgi:hypothetical protein
MQFVPFLQQPGKSVHEIFHTFPCLDTAHPRASCRKISHELIRSIVTQSIRLVKQEDSVLFDESLHRRWDIYIEIGIALACDQVWEGQNTDCCIGMKYPTNREQVGIRNETAACAYIRVGSDKLTRLSLSLLQYSPQHRQSSVHQQYRRLRPVILLCQATVLRRRV